jgi:SAM-dependent methyltransferase
MIDYSQGWETKWDDMRRLGPCSRHHRRIVREMLAGLEVSSLLDAGCGPGTTLLELRELFPHASLHGVDFAESAVRMARQRLPEASFTTLDLEKSHLDRRFDLVVCLDVVEHLPEDRAAFRNVAAMTEGLALFSTLQGRMRRTEAAVGHVRNYRRGELAERVAEAGLDPVRVVEWGWPLYSPLHRNLLEHVPEREVTGHFGPWQRLASHVLHAAFRLNSHRRGDYVFLLAARPGSAARIPEHARGRPVGRAACAQKS